MKTNGGLMMMMVVVVVSTILITIRGDTLPSEVDVGQEVELKLENQDMIELPQWDAQNAVSVLNNRVRTFRPIHDLPPRRSISLSLSLCPRTLCVFPLFKCE